MRRKPQPSLRVALDEIVEDGVRRPLVEALLDQPFDDDVLKGVEPSLAVGPAGILGDDEVQQDPGDVVAPRPPFGLQPLAIGPLPFALLLVALPDRLPHALFASITRPAWRLVLCPPLPDRRRRRKRRSRRIGFLEGGNADPEICNACPRF